MHGGSGDETRGTSRLHAPAEADLLIRGRQLLDEHGAVPDGWVHVQGDVIVAVGSGPDAPHAEQEIDYGDNVVVPGFIDLHGHGGGGADYGDGAQAIHRALQLHRAHGTTRSVLSLVSTPVPETVAALSAVRSVMADDPLVLGAHLEGPFLAAGRKGAHDASALREPDAAVVDELLRAGEDVVRQVTIAPELTGGLEAVRRFRRAGVRVAVGHTQCSAAEARAAFDAGATILTHTFNAMPGLHHRDPGPIAAAIADDRVTLELVLDGAHVHPDVARILLAAAPHRVALVTDAMRAAGVGDGSYQLGPLDVEVTDGVARLQTTGTIAGSTLTQDRALRLAIETVGIAPEAAVAALTAVPARALGEDTRLGLLAPGFAADLVVLDADWSPVAVWADGRVIEQ